MSSAVGFLLLVCLMTVGADLVPIHVYLSLTGNPSQMQVTFTTTTKPSSAEVQYWVAGSTTKTTVHVVDADVTTFKRPVTATLNYINSVTLTNLTRGQSYNYQVIGNTHDAATTSSKVFKFKHIPPVGQGVSIGIYGDLGSYGHALTQTNANGLKAWVAAGKFDLILHNGDLAYNLATDHGAVGDMFMKNIEPISSSLPYIVTPGNHEFMDNDEAYYRNFWAGQRPLAKSSKSAGGPMWWSFDIGTAHIVGISTEVYCEDTSNIKNQWTWLEADLKAASSRAEKPWIVVLGHRPLYSGQSSSLHMRLMRLGLQCTDANLTKCDPLKSCDSGKDCGFSIQALLVKYNVDMFNAGHEHIYLRNNPIGANLHFESHPDEAMYENPQSPLHIISGAPGTAHTPKLQERALEGASPAVKESGAVSFSTMVLHNSTHLHYYQVNADTGAIVDNFWIVKSKDKPNFKSVAFTVAADKQTACDQ